MIALEELVKLIPRIIIAIVLFFIFITAFSIFMPKKEVIQAEKDFLRVVDEIKELGENEEITVPLMSKNYKEDYNYKFYDKEASDLPYKCKKENCLCLYKKGSTQQQYLQCKPIKDIKIIPPAKPLDMVKEKKSDLFLKRNKDVITMALKT